jgi:hypothetical protein
LAYKMLSRVGLDRAGFYRIQQPVHNLQHQI